jgi:hypothetical protein
MQDIPVILLNYNRPEYSQRLLNNLSRVKPKKIYISIDGPKIHVEGDKTKVDKVEEIFKGINWECEVKVRRNQSNLGLRPAVKSALDWFFGENEFGIVLEDDVGFDENFFKYCKEFSEFNEEMRIGAISGNNLMAHMFSQDFFQPKYLLAKIFHCWGWATWSHRWKNYDDNIENDENFFKNILPEYLNYDVQSINFWYGIRAAIQNNAVNTWAWRFLLSNWKHGLYFLTPPQNLTTNYGFGADSTHCGELPFYMQNIQIGKYTPYDPSEYEIQTSLCFERIEERFILGIDRSPLLL